MQDHHRGWGVFEKVWGFTKTWFSKISKHRWEAKRNRVLGTCRALGVGGESRLSARTYLKHRSDIGAKWGENVEAKWGENEAKLLGIHSKKLGPIGALQAIRLSVNVRGEKTKFHCIIFFSASPRCAQPANEPLSLNFMLSSWSLKYSQTDLNYPKVASFEIWVTFEMLKSVPELTLCDDAWYWVVLYWVTGVTLVLGRVKISKTGLCWIYSISPCSAIIKNAWISSKGISIDQISPVHFIHRMHLCIQMSFCCRLQGWILAPPGSWR